MVSDEGLKRKHGEIGVHESKKLTCAIEEKTSEAEEVFHNIVMRLMDHSENGDALWFQVGEELGRFSINKFGLITGMKCIGSTHLPPVAEPRLIRRYFPTVRGVSRENLELQMSNANIDNDEDAAKLSLLYLIFCIPLSNANSVKIDPKFFVLADNLAEFNDLPWGVLSWEATRSAICNTVDNKTSSKKIPLKKYHQVHYSIAGFPHALLVWAYESLPTIASKFITNYDPTISRMLSWITADNIKFDDVMWAFTAVGKNQVIYLFMTTPVYATTRLGHSCNDRIPSTVTMPKCFVIMPTEKELKDPWVAQLYLKNPKGVPQLLPKPYVPQPSSGTNSEWQEFKKEIRGQGEGKAQPETLVTSRQTNDVLIDSDIGAAADIGVQVAMEFLTADKAIVSHQFVKEESIKEKLEETLEGNVGEGMVQSDPFDEIKEESMPHLEKEKKREDKDDKNIISGHDVVQPEGPAKEDSTSDVVPKKKRARLSRLGQRPTGSRTEVGSSAHAPSKIIGALSPGLEDEPPADTLKEFREYINKGVLKRTPPE
ncbi:hypothetical protein TIFTF001_029838 [Ficus carica]|uniref:DUF1985 domain-containing protein n=1 Tax=Ficus carica TaxID=3494 RepID=A0AA88J200_FICCA|nr:hypothetical protein TIFTF001_029838 [Ficus carica]